jgi:hypothetical protein
METQLSQDLPQLEMVAVVARHGLRTPFKPFESDKSSNWRCGASDSAMQIFLNRFILEKTKSAETTSPSLTVERAFPHNHSETSYTKERPLLPRGDCYGGQLTYLGKRLSRNNNS